MASDEIWQQYGVTSWRAEPVRLRVVIWTSFSLVMVTAFLWGTGAVTPHINWNINSFFAGAWVDEKSGALSTRFFVEIENEGSTTFTVSGLSMNIPGLRLLPAENPGAEKVTVEGGDMEVMERHVAITDCAAVPHTPQPVRFTYETYLGARTAEVTWDSWQLTGPDGATVPVAWQRGLSDKVCSEAVSDEWP
ncbi:hypothetical protein [Nonomuraea sp. NPDC049725]|uniref:hypothetical protein n=1 Tax=Nonomuraea sp. NPDC049725 TaxID=3154508 RepID=UPI0034189C9B